MTGASFFIPMTLKGPNGGMHDIKEIYGIMYLKYLAIGEKIDKIVDH